MDSPTKASSLTSSRSLHPTAQQRHALLQVSPSAAKLPSTMTNMGALLSHNPAQGTRQIFANPPTQPSCARPGGNTPIRAQAEHLLCYVIHQRKLEASSNECVLCVCVRALRACGRNRPNKRQTNAIAGRCVLPLCIRVGSALTSATCPGNSGTWYIVRL